MGQYKEPEPASVSPWRTLAERLFSPMGLEKTKAGLFIWVINEPLNIETVMAQDLLIGRAFRVALTAWNRYKLVPNEYDMLISRVACMEGDYRAIAALELLDAVGYEHA